jgi:hypothetical protein
MGMVLRMIGGLLSDERGPFVDGVVLVLDRWLAETDDRTVTRWPMAPGSPVPAVRRKRGGR